jgi:hypothetical protein
MSVIVVGVDHSAGAREALRFALEDAAASGEVACRSCLAVRLYRRNRHGGCPAGGRG